MIEQVCFPEKLNGSDVEADRGRAQIEWTSSVRKDQPLASHGMWRIVKVHLPYQPDPAVHRIVKDRSQAVLEQLLLQYI